MELCLLDAPEEKLETAGREIIYTESTFTGHSSCESIKTPRLDIETFYGTSIYETMNLRKEECQMNAFRIMLGALVFLSFGVIEANAIDQSICDSGTKVVLYPSGSLRSCVLKDSFHLKEMDCSGQNPISFYEDGQIETCVLSERTTISGQTCRQFGSISFYPDGKFKSCVKED